MVGESEQSSEWLLYPKCRRRVNSWFIGSPVLWGLGRGAQGWWSMVFPCICISNSELSADRRTVLAGQNSLSLGSRMMTIHRDGLQSCTAVITYVSNRCANLLILTSCVCTVTAAATLRLLTAELDECLLIEILALLAVQEERRSLP